jgi:hypothetical protein
LTHWRRECCTQFPRSMLEASMTTTMEPILPAVGMVLFPLLGGNFRTLSRFHRPFLMICLYIALYIRFLIKKLICAGSRDTRCKYAGRCPFYWSFQGREITMALAFIMPKRARRTVLAACLLLALKAQGQSQNASAESTQEAGTSTDLFVMFGSDFVRPGLEPKANYNIGIGHTFGFLKKDPVGDELTFSYTYEDGGSGFWHSQFGSHTESAGVMKNFALPKTKWVSGYTWIQAGISSLTGNPHVENLFYNGESLGAVVHFNDHNSIWIQETFNKIVTVPWYTTTSIGYTRSW